MLRSSSEAKAEGLGLEGGAAAKWIRDGDWESRNALGLCGTYGRRMVSGRRAFGEPPTRGRGGLDYPPLNLQLAICRNPEVF